MRTRGDPTDSEDLDFFPPRLHAHYSTPGVWLATVSCIALFMIPFASMYNETNPQVQANNFVLCFFPLLCWNIFVMAMTSPYCGGLKVDDVRRWNWTKPFQPVLRAPACVCN